MAERKSPEATKQHGFTLIELMITVTILGILSAIAIGSYREFNIRSKVSEGLVSLSPFTTAVGTYYWGESRLPISRADAGVSNIVTKYIDEVTITSNSYISVDFNDSAIGVTNMYLILKPRIGTGAISWECTVSNTAAGITRASQFLRYVPPDCR